MDEPPRFIQVMNDLGLAYLRKQELDGANVYTIKKDRAGMHIICVGFDKQPQDPLGDYQGHTHIVRCRTEALRDQAERIVREKLGYPPQTRAPLQREARP